MKDVEPGVVADGPVCHGLCGAQPAPSRPAAKRYVRLYDEMNTSEPSDHTVSTIPTLILSTTIALFFIVLGGGLVLIIAFGLAREFLKVGGPTIVLWKP